MRPFAGAPMRSCKLGSGESDGFSAVNPGESTGAERAIEVGEVTLPARVLDAGASSEVLHPRRVTAEA